MEIWKEKLRKIKNYTTCCKYQSIVIHISRKINKNQKLHNLLIKKVMTPRPISISQDMLATKALSIMQDKKITALCVNSNKSKYKTTGVLHIHNILRANI